MDGQSLSRRQTAAVLAISVVAGCVPPLQPMLLGALLNEGRITADAMGYAATAEGLGMALMTAVAGAWLPARGIRLIGALSLVAVLAANAMTIMLPPTGIVVARGLSGLGNGLLLWILVNMLARSALPARLFAIYITANASLVFLLSMALGTFAISRFGAAAGYEILIGIYGLLLLTVRFLPNAFADLGGAAKAALPPPMGLLALVGVVLFLAGVMAFWIYSVPLAGQAGIATDSMQMIIGAATGVQIIAGLSAVALAARLSGTQAVTITTALAMSAVAATMLSSSEAVWLPAILVLAFCWIFGPPFHIPFLNVADPSRQAAIFFGTAQLVGLAVGPLLGATAVSATDYGPVRLVSIACFAAVLAIAAVVHLRSRLVVSSVAEA